MGLIYRFIFILLVTAETMFTAQRSRLGFKGTIEAIIRDIGEDTVYGLLRGKRVLLKPNLCIDFPPERGATTHPAVVEAMVQIALDAGAKVTIGDGAAIGIKGNTGAATGMLSICKKYGLPFRDFNREEGKLIKIDPAFKMKEAVIARSYFEADTIVNLPVFKSNLLFGISGALKNMKGFLVGMEKHKPHYLGVPQCVADVNKVLRQDLIIMDGTIGMMGNGPACGAPANARLLIGGFDPVAVDHLALRLMGMNPRIVPMIRYAIRSKLGSDQYEVAGDSLGSFQLDFEKPLVARNRLAAYLMGNTSRVVFRIFGRGSRMAVNSEKCTHCARCRDMCPFHAIEIINREVVIDRNKCEFCMCCTEVCAAGAISLQGILRNKGRIFRPD
jgi:uncharacterized protein (DUF362 family)/NAD-dependent dihydropyrimidine dehydrogenase PreA subunit